VEKGAIIVGNCCHILTISQDFVPSEFHLFGPLKEFLEGLKFNDNQDVQQHAFQTSSAPLTEIFCAMGVMTTRETLGTLRKNIILNSDKNVFLLATVVFLKEIVLELIECPSYILFLVMCWIKLTTLKCYASAVEQCICSCSGVSECHMYFGQDMMTLYLHHYHVFYSTTLLWT